MKIKSFKIDGKDVIKASVNNVVVFKKRTEQQVTINIIEVTLLSGTSVARRGIVNTYVYVSENEAQDVVEFKVYLNEAEMTNLSTKETGYIKEVNGVNCKEYIVSYTAPSTKGTHTVNYFATSENGKSINGYDFTLLVR